MTVDVSPLHSRVVDALPSKDWSVTDFMSFPRSAANAVVPLGRQKLRLKWRATKPSVVWVFDLPMSLGAEKIELVGDAVEVLSLGPSLALAFSATSDNLCVATTVRIPPLPEPERAPVEQWESLPVCADCAEALDRFTPLSSDPLSTWMRAGALLRLAKEDPVAPGIGTPLDWAYSRPADEVELVARRLCSLAELLAYTLEEAMSRDSISEVELELICRDRERLEDLRAMLPKLEEASYWPIGDEVKLVDGRGGVFVTDWREAVGLDVPSFWDKPEWRLSANADWDVWWNGAWLVDVSGYDELEEPPKARFVERLYRNWTFHNLIAHPLSEVLYLLGFKKLSGRVHDATVPDHEPGTGRG